MTEKDLLTDTKICKNDVFSGIVSRRGKTSNFFHPRKLSSFKKKQRLPKNIVRSQVIGLETGSHEWVQKAEVISQGVGTKTGRKVAGVCHADFEL